MQLFAVIGVALVIIYLAWIKPRYMRSAVPKKPLIVLAVIFVLLGASEGRWQYLQWRGSEAVKEVSGNPNGVLECQRFLPSLFDMDSAALGGKVTSIEPNVAILKNRQCNALFDWVQSGSGDTMTMSQIIAVHVLSHESVHVSGQFSESIAECTSMQRDPIAARSLGASDEAGELIQSEYFANIHPQLGESYKLDGCKIDPKLDTIANPKPAE